MDKLDKTLEELQKGKRKKVVEKTIKETPLSFNVDNVVYGQCSICGGPLTNGHICDDIIKEAGENIAKEIDEEIVKEIIEESIKNQQDEWTGNPKIEQTFQESIKQIGLKDTYLPFVLTKLKFCGNNTEARQLIKNGKVKINNNVVSLIYSTKELSNFLLEVDNVKYEIFKID